MSSFRRRLMSMACPVLTERLLYSLTDYTCDGTINTFIDTGLRLFSHQCESFRIEIQYDGLDLTMTGLETILECKDLVVVDVYQGGLSLRTDINQTALSFNCKPNSDDIRFQNASSATVSIEYDRNHNSITVNGSTTVFSGSIFHEEPLTIGGRYASANTPDRFVQCHISSLRVYVKELIGNEIIKMQNYTCDGTVKTTINTKYYLFDANEFPNGWKIEFDFTIGSGNAGQASYLRCRSAQTPYNGFTLRRHNTDATKMQIQLNSASTTVSGNAGERHNVVITNDSTICTIKVDGDVVLSQNNLQVASPLVIGGELSTNDVDSFWNTGRYAKLQIHSLVVTKN